MTKTSSSQPPYPGVLSQIRAQTEAGYGPYSPVASVTTTRSPDETVPSPSYPGKEAPRSQNSDESNNTLIGVGIGGAALIVALIIVVILCTVK